MHFQAKNTFNYHRYHNFKQAPAVCCVAPSRRSAAIPRLVSGSFLLLCKKESPPSIWSLGTLTGLSEILR
jgi:hypothetical protein